MALMAWHGTAGKGQGHKGKSRQGKGIRAWHGMAEQGTAEQPAFQLPKVCMYQSGGYMQKVGTF